jgi:hypothetical protein
MLNGNAGAIFFSTPGPASTLKSIPYSLVFTKNIRISNLLLFHYVSNCKNHKRTIYFNFTWLTLIILASLRDCDRISEIVDQTIKQNSKARSYDMRFCSLLLRNVPILFTCLYADVRLTPPLKQNPKGNSLGWGYPRTHSHFDSDISSLKCEQDSAFPWVLPAKRPFYQRFRTITGQL